MEFNASLVKEQCVQWIRDWFKANGDGCNAVIGISGGADSTVVAGLCVEALGKDRVVGVLMPNGEQADIKDSYAVVDHLGIRSVTAQIEDTYNEVLRRIENVRICDENGYCRIEYLTPSDQARINLAPRLRMAVLYAVSQSVNGRVANTCNLSEDYIGYSTRYGDGAGDFSPLGGLTKDEVVAIGDALGLPEYLVHKVPSDGLCGKTDEDNFGFTYADLNRYIRTGECDNPEVKAKIKSLHDRNLFKLKTIPHFHHGLVYWG